VENIMMKGTEQTKNRKRKGNSGNIRKQEGKERYKDT
jgi:hypothetical protein